jgi:hypothetical protein
VSPISIMQTMSFTLYPGACRRCWPTRSRVPQSQCCKCTPFMPRQSQEVLRDVLLTLQVQRLRLLLVTLCSGTVSIVLSSSRTVWTTPTKRTAVGSAENIDPATLYMSKGGLRRFAEDQNVLKVHACSNACCKKSLNATAMLAA